MNKHDLIVLKFINEYKELPSEKIYNHFAKRFPDTSIDVALWHLEVDYDYIREHDGVFTITDRGESEAYSYIIELHEIWKNRIIGFVFGVLTSVVATGCIALIKLAIGLI